MNLIAALLNLLFPEKCLLCRKVLANGEIDLCRHCRCDNPAYTHRKSRPQFLDSFTAVWYYEEDIRSSLLRYKFGGCRSYAPGYGRLLAMVLQKNYPDGFDLITWVPVSRFRKWKRGYDQVELIARAAAGELGTEPVALMKKIRHTRPQSSLREYSQRKANVLGAYQVLNPAEVAGKRILLLDDILTTGATASECARILKTAGAAEVHCAAMAAARK